MPYQIPGRGLKQPYDSAGNFWGYFPTGFIPQCNCTPNYNRNCPPGAIGCTSVIKPTKCPTGSIDCRNPTVPTCKRGYTSVCKNRWCSCKPNA